MSYPEMRIGIDLGGTKIEALALDRDGQELVRYRIDTPREDYRATLLAMAGLVRRIEQETGSRATVGAGIPGTISSQTGLVKNANSTWLNGQPLARDLSAELAREVRVANDANCLAVSEATDGAAAGARLVFGVILGTGAGGGVAIHGTAHNGPNGVGGRVGAQSSAVGDGARASGAGLLLRQAWLHGDLGVGHGTRARLRGGHRAGR